MFSFQRGMMTVVVVAALSYDFAVPVRGGGGEQGRRNLCTMREYQVDERSSDISKLDLAVSCATWKKKSYLEVGMSWSIKCDPFPKRVRPKRH